ncbi:Myb-like_DNA-binding domain-containing protein [Hexamita inflata]|uniref:Myb-like DNA-binding domain-containing protein n=1 Tax=Hexamita inflata TaxID=28002 RepID=A0AA86QXR4_9EUKA|nr:Myb-like DNA-binding domain-containing protein [Hexamita inflata]
MYNKEYKNWTELERSQLVAVVEQSKRKCGQVDWDEVAKCMPSRSRQQCKSYFMNIYYNQSILYNDLIFKHKYSLVMYILLAIIYSSKLIIQQIINHWFSVIFIQAQFLQYNNKIIIFSILKKDCDVKMVKYHTWTEQEVGLLLWCAEAESKNWDAIQQNYFPKLTKHQLQAKHSYLVQQQLKAKAKTDSFLVNGSEDVTQQTSSAQSGLERSEDLVLISQLRDILNGVASK